MALVSPGDAATHRRLSRTVDDFCFRAGQALDPSDFPILIRPVLLDDADVSLSAGHIDAAVAGIPDNFVGVFRGRKSGDGLPGVGIQNKQLARFPRDNEQPVSWLRPRRSERFAPLP